MQTNEETRLNQQATEEGSPSAAASETPAAASSGATRKKASKKKASKKKASKKKASKKKASKKKASKKKASKKKASKKKASKKKASKKRGKKKASAAAGNDPYAQMLAALEELTDAVKSLATQQIAHQRQAVEDLRKTARAKISDLEAAAQSSLARLTGKG